MNPIGRRISTAAIVLLAAAIAHAEPPPKTFVSLSGSSEDPPRLGNPIVRVEVLSESPAISEGLAAALVADLSNLVHARPEIGDANFDYRLRVGLVLPPAGGAPEPCRFEASLEEPDRGVVWRTEGSSEVGGDGEVTQVLPRISRNLVSALVHDRWVVPKEHPNDPPPAAPSVLKSFP